MRRPLVVAGLSALVAIGCWRVAQPSDSWTSPDGVGIEGIVIADGGGHCHFYLEPDSPGQCQLQVDHYTKHPEYVGRWSTDQRVPCGQSAEVCGAFVPCDCARGREENPCGDASVESLLRFPSATDDCFVSVRPPSSGGCRASVRTGGSSGNVEIPLNQSRKLCGGTVEQRCACEDFATRCTFEIAPPADGRCQIKSKSCEGGRCEDLGMVVWLGEAAMVCSQTVMCTSQSGDSADGGK